jgi:xanthine dehydrogenase accessory factor
VRHRLLAEAAAMAARGEAYVLATVVWRQGPSSGQAGASAIITPDGRVRGWLGGACAEPTVVREALAALQDGQPRLLSMGVDECAGGAPRPGVVTVSMACASEGALEVFVEPMLPSPLLVAIGRSPAVDALVAMAGALDWRTAVVDDGGAASDHPTAGEVVTDLDLSGLRVDERAFVVVATQGHYDEPALQAALATPAGYVGLVASAKRASTVLEWLRDRGVADEVLARVHAPAGLDLGHVGHEEMAVAILAELVALKAGGGVPVGVTVATPEEAVDPVCGMTVDVASAHYVTEHDGVTYWFCAPGCQKAFEADPEGFLTT